MEVRTEEEETSQSAAVEPTASGELLVPAIVKSVPNSAGQAGTGAEQSAKKQKRLVSFDVFMKYVDMGEGRVDVTNVFSKSCFEEWIKNRKQTPKEPEESFRKALVAHVSGKDDRKPFVPEVEFEILRRLRKSEPWPCFSDSINGANKIGERGLKKSSMGYHEGKRKRAEEYGPVVPGVGPGFQNMPSHPSAHAPLRYQYYPLPHPQMHVTPGVFPHYYHYPQHFYPPPAQYLAHPSKRANTMSSGRHQSIQVKDMQMQDNLKAAVSFCFDQVQEKSASGDFAKSLIEFYSGAELRKLFENIPGLFNSEVAAEMNRGSSLFFQKLETEQASFDDKKPLGQAILDVFGHILSADKYVNALIKEPAQYNIFVLLRDPVERALSLTHMLKSLMKTASSVCRWELNIGGAAKTFVCKLDLGANRTITCRLQSVSEGYHPHISQSHRV